MQITKYATMIAVALACVAGQAAAADSALAQATSVNGSVVVNRDGKTAPLASAAALTAGDRIVSMDGGQAQIKFADGCVIQVGSNAVATVGAKSPCAASGLVGTSAPMQFGDAGTALFGFLAVAAVTWLVFEASDNGNSPLSP